MTTQIDTSNINTVWASLIVEELLRSGVDTFFLAPGSRCTPLTVAVARCGRARIIRHFDERGLAFAAVGYGRATGRAAVVIMTSGTAVANALPAVVEADEDHIPLLVLSADRPPELRDVTANQSIDQVHIFGRRVRWFFDLPCPTREIAPATALTCVDHAVFRTRGGPVHVNCMFREPLEPSTDGVNHSGYIASLDGWRNATTPYTSYVEPLLDIPDSAVEHVAAICGGAKRGVIVVGRLGPGYLFGAVHDLAQKLNWPVFPDIASGFRLGGEGEVTAAHYDHVLLADGFVGRAPWDVVLHLGGRVTSKRLAQQIERVPPRHYVWVSPHERRSDPLHRVTLRLTADVGQFCGALDECMEPAGDDGWLRKWLAASAACGATLQRELTQGGALSEPAVAHALSNRLRAGDALFLANSMPVRDMDMYGAAQAQAVRVDANRGASGIDGNLATACGFGMGLGRSVTLLAGDMAMLHDLNSLPLVHAAGKPVVVVVINNNGSGIFSFLPIARHADVFEEYFGTPHGFNFEHAAGMFGLDYARPKDLTTFAAEYDRARERGRSTLIEVVTDRARNVEFHALLQSRAKAAV